MIIISETNQAVVLPFTNDISSLYPNAPRLSMEAGEHAVLQHDIVNTVLLRRMGYTIPNPMLKYYNWHGGTPFDVQKATCDLLTTNARAYVLNDMGTGKTKAALWAWDYLNSISHAGKLLVLAPLSTLRYVWINEIFSTIPSRKAVVLHGSKQQRLKMLAEDADIYVINHDGLGVILDELRARPDIDCVVIDELATFRNGGAKRTKLLRQYAKTKKWVWGMTGAPMPNQPTDVWAQATIINPHTVPKYFSHCRDMLMYRVDEFLWKPKEGAAELAYSYLQPAVRFTLDEVTELPDIVLRDIDVALTQEQASAYRAMANTFHARAVNKQITAANAGAAMNKLMQISGGWVYDELHAIVPIPNEPRLQALIDCIESSSARKVIVFAPFLHTVQGVAEALAKSGIGHLIVTGETRNREEIFTQFQALNSIRCLVAHPKCMAHGLTLTEADTIVWFLPITSLDTYEQANARIRRVGQRRKQQILHLVGTPVERKLYKMLRTKQNMQDKFLALFEDVSILETYK